MKTGILFILSCLILVSGCYNEDALTPTTEPESVYSLPQGNHDYDTKIVDWNKRCEFYILYRFDPKEIYWNLTTWEGLTWREMDGAYDASTFKGLPAEEVYVGKQLELVEEEFLNFYPDSTLKQLMPIKLLLCSVLWRPSGADSVDMACRSGFDYIAVNYGNESVDALTSEARDELRTEINAAFLKKATDGQKIRIPEEFASISKYGKESTDVNNMYGKGFICPDGYFGKQTKEDDWNNYIRAIVSTNYEDLVAEPDPDESLWGDPTFIGILHPDKDINGFILKKYQVLIAFFKERYGVDLQAIGNKMAPVWDDDDSGEDDDDWWNDDNDDWNDDNDDWDDDNDDWDDDNDDWDDDFWGF